ncbi:ribosomal protein L7/L12 [Streptomyces sp. MUSC 14]|uniref:ribosomal protein L7/L12 n=1 Tax=Streptomyces sp. MUSC 14 TaxID=1354889 RepID=UPI0008F5ABB5|nr:ribosomal protein L7/L12 [Streptomyces sp. MUSC 14]
MTDVAVQVVLLDDGPSLLEVAKVFRLMTGLGLWHAKQTVTAAPLVLLFERLKEAAARERAGYLRAAGASATVAAVDYKGSRLTSSPPGPRA